MDVQVDPNLVLSSPLSSEFTLNKNLRGVGYTEVRDGHRGRKETGTMNSRCIGWVCMGVVDKHERREYEDGDVHSQSFILRL